MNTGNEVTKAWKVTQPFDGLTSKDFLVEAGGFSRQLLKKVRLHESIFINGERRKLWQPLSTGDELVVLFPEEAKGYIIPQKGPLSIVYEDEDVLVIDKPSGLPVVPPLDAEKPSIASFLLHEYEKRGYPCTVHIVTRLDRDTSGLLLVAKHAYSHMLLTKHLDQVTRRYQAVVHGSFEGEAGKVDEPIQRAEGSIICRTVSRDGKPSQTKYELLKRGKHYSIIQLRLLTGRTHQIRVHMAHIGFPLAGDTLYGGHEVEGMIGHALHCDQLYFKHPWTKKIMMFNSEPPAIWHNFFA